MKKVEKFKEEVKKVEDTAREIVKDPPKEPVIMKTASDGVKEKMAADAA